MPGDRDQLVAADLVLVHRAAAGDRDAFGAIFERYHQAVYRFARAMTGSREAAEDVTQEVFVVLIRELRRYRPEQASLGTYLYGIARNVSRDRLRRDRRLLSFVSRATTHAGNPRPLDPLEIVVATEIGTEVRRALARIPVKYREVLVLCDVHDLAYAEAGIALRLSTAAVRSRLHRARQLLKKRLCQAEKPGLRQRACSSVRCAP
jgi:RNA polymerase sigma-70 factor (ECF subfamily)